VSKIFNLLDFGENGGPALSILKDGPDELLDLLGGEELGQAAAALAPSLLNLPQAGIQHDHQLLELGPALHVAGERVRLAVRSEEVGGAGADLAEEGGELAGRLGGNVRQVHNPLDDLLEGGVQQGPDTPAGEETACQVFLFCAEIK